MSNNDLLVLFTITACVTYFLSLFIGSSKGLIETLTIILIINALCLLLYFMLYSFHIHLSLLNFILWALIAKEIMKILHMKKLRKLLNK